MKSTLENEILKYKERHNQKLIEDCIKNGKRQEKRDEYKTKDVIWIDELILDALNKNPNVLRADDVIAGLIGFCAEINGKIRYYMIKVEDFNNKENKQCRK